MSTYRITRLLLNVLPALFLATSLNMILDRMSLQPTLAEGNFTWGSGTEADSYLVATAVYLDNVRNHQPAYFHQTVDFSLGLFPWNKGENCHSIDMVLQHPTIFLSLFSHSS